MVISVSFCPVEDAVLALRYPVEYFWLRCRELELAKRVVERLLKEAA